MYKILIFVIIIAGLSGCLQEKEVEKEKSILVYTSKCMQNPMTEIGQIFEQKNGIKVEYVFGGSRALMDDIIKWKRGDVYVPGSESYAKQAEGMGYLDTYVIVAHHPLTIIVPKENQADIKTLYNLTNDSVRLGLGDPMMTAVGRMTFKIFENANITDEITDNYIVLYESDCADMIPTLLDGETDAAINCIPSSYNFKEMIALIEIPPEVNLERRASIGVLTFSKDKDNANKFVDFVASEEGKAIFKKYGFTPSEG